MLPIAIRALCLIGILKVLADEEISFGQGAGLALGASLGSSLLYMSLAPWLGAWAILVALNLVGLGLGAGISAFCGTEIKRSFLIAAAYIVVDLGITIGLAMLFR